MLSHYATQWAKWQYHFNSTKLIVNRHCTTTFDNYVEQKVAILFFT
jgi:hypothetical protein